ncbi:hypothetical protein Peur_017578 [Populus x canadensis]
MEHYWLSQFPDATSMDYQTYQNYAPFDQIYFRNSSRKDFCDKILMPPSALDRLAMLEISYPISSEFSDVID